MMGDRSCLNHACTIAVFLVSALASHALAIERPTGNTGTGFFVYDGEVYDANGFPFRIRGVNHTHAFGNQSHNTAAIPEIAKSNANTVRMVFFGSGLGITLTPAQQRARVMDYLDLGIVPIVELHDYTGGNNDTTDAAIEAAVDYWLEPERKAYLKEFEREVILNIANEWGPNSTVWRDAYIEGVQRLRDAGVNNLIMIDAGGNFGQNPRSLKSWGMDVLNADPQKNILFSQHMYGYWFTNPSVPGWAYSVRDELTAMKLLGLPLVIGEFSWEEHGEVNYDTSEALEIYEELGVGWLAWAWYRGANPGDVLSMVANVNGSHSYTYNDDSDLTEFGDLVINDPQTGLKSVAQKASIFFQAGDFNLDGVVDAADYTVWRDNADGYFTPSDYFVWATNYGDAGGTGLVESIASESVPEPCSWVTMTLIMAWLSVFDRKRRVPVPAV